MLMRESHWEFRSKWPGNWHNERPVCWHHWKMWCMGGEL